MIKAVQEIVADLRKADMMGVRVDAGAVADQIELAFARLEEHWSLRVKDALAVADQFKGALDQRRISPDRFTPGYYLHCMPMRRVAT